MTDLRAGLPTLQSFAEGEIDYDLLPPRLRPHSLHESVSPLWRNLVLSYLRIQELHLNGISADFQPMATDQPKPAPCALCKGTRTLLKGYQERLPVYVQCPTCAEEDKERAKQELRQTINAMWRIPTPVLSDFLPRPDAPNSMIARAAQQSIMEQMPSSVSLLLYGPTGTGKSRLLSEIAIVARSRGLSSIYKNFEPLRQIVYDFSGETDIERQKARTRRETAWKHLTLADVVVLDEVDHAEGTAIHERLLELLNWRYDHNLTTAIGANSFKGMLDPVISRLKAKGNLHVCLDGDSDARRWFGHSGMVAVAGGD